MIKKLALCSLVSLIASQAYAHTGVRDKVTASQLATTNSYNGFTITHGCGGDNGDAYPVLGQAAVFPTGANVAWRDAAGVVFAHGGGGSHTGDGTTGQNIFATTVSVTDPLTLVTTTTEPGLNLAVTGYAGFGSAFATSQEIVDPALPGVVQGLLWKDGAMEPKLNTITPFKITVPKIIDPTVKQVNLRIAVVNFCDTEQNATTDAVGPYKQPKDAFGRNIPILATALAPTQINVAGAPNFVTIKAGNGDNNRADWWFTALDGGSLLWNDPQLLQPTYWTTLTIVNGDPAAVAATKIVSVEPTGAAVDAILTGPNTRPFTKGLTNL